MIFAMVMCRNDDSTFTLINIIGSGNCPSLILQYVSFSFLLKRLSLLLSYLKLMYGYLEIVDSFTVTQFTVLH